MNSFVENIASSGDLQQMTADMRVVLYVFVFSIIITVTMSVIGYLKGLGK